jgi:hypothetical protein
MDLKWRKADVAGPHIARRRGVTRVTRRSCYVVRMSRRAFPRNAARCSLVALGVLGIGAYATSAGAYCRATTTDCDPLSQTCAVDAHNCLTTGAPLWWSGGEVALAVSAEGSAALGITGDDARAALQTALAAWVSADCPGGGHPDLHVAVPVLQAGLTLGFNPDGSNQNVMVFFDEHWPFPQNVLAKTALGFSRDTGELRDADLAFNSQDYVFVTDPPASPAEIDLVAVLTHEVGHVLGLGHSDVPAATMRPETQGFATPELRTLDPDDMAGICAIYPPGHAPVNEEALAPPTEQAAGCSGCAVPRRSGEAPVAPLVALTVFLAFARRAPRRR